MTTPGKKRAAQKAWVTRHKKRDVVLIGQLLAMADDMQIGGDIHFRRLAGAGHKGLWTKAQRRTAQRLLKKAGKLLEELQEATEPFELSHEYLYSYELENQR